MKKIIVVLLGLSLFNAVNAFAEMEADTMETSKWAHESEVGIILVGGNSQSNTLNAKQTTSNTFSKNKITFTGHLQLGSSSGTLNSRNWSLGLRYDRELSEKFSAFLGYTLEGDTFSGVKNRSNVDAGAKYIITKKDDKNYFFAELGYRLQIEKSLLNISTTNHLIRGYLEAQKEICDTTTFKLWVEALPDVTTSSNFNLNFEPSLRVAMSSNLALKLAYLGKFDNLPSAAGLKKFDFTYTTALVANF